MKDLKRASIRIRPRPVEHFVRPQHHHQLVFANVCDVMGPARYGFHDFGLIHQGQSG